MKDTQNNYLIFKLDELEQKLANKIIKTIKGIEFNNTGNNESDFCYLFKIKDNKIIKMLYSEYLKASFILNKDNETI